jgi:hypothetical protein
MKKNSKKNKKIYGGKNFTNPLKEPKFNPNQFKVGIPINPITQKKLQSSIPKSITMPPGISIPKGISMPSGMPSMPGIPPGMNMPSMSSMSPGMPPGMSMSGIPPGMPSMPSMPPGMPSIPGIPPGMNMPSMPPGMPSMPPGMNMPSMPPGMNMPSMPPGMPSMSPGMPSMSPGMPSMPPGMSTPSIPGMSGEGQSMGQFDQIKDIAKIFDIFKPDLLKVILKNVRNINPKKFDKIPELKQLTSAHKIRLKYLKYIAKYVNVLNKNDINLFIKNFMKNFTKNLGVKVPSQLGNSNLMGNMMGNSGPSMPSPGLDLYIVKDISGIIMDIDESMFNLIELFVHDQIKFAKKAMNEGNVSEAIDVKMIPKLLVILDQLSISNIEKILNILKNNFGIIIPLGGFAFKGIIKSLKILFPYKEAKLTNNIKDQLRYLLTLEDIKSDEERGNIEKYRNHLKKNPTYETLSNYPYKLRREVSLNLVKRKDVCLLFVLLITSFYLTHNPKLLDKDKLKAKTKEFQKMGINAETVKEMIRKRGVEIYKQFVNSKGVLLLLTKLALKYYHNSRDDIKFMNICYHIFHSFYTENQSMNIFNPYFDLNKYLLKIQEESIKENGFIMESYLLNISKIFFGKVTSIENILDQIYIDVFKKQSMKLKLINMTQNSEVEFIKLLQKILNRNYYAYISNTSNTNVSQLRMYNNINVAKPTFFSIHKLKISDYETINKFILRANLSSTKTNSRSNSNNEVRWSNSNRSSNSNSTGNNIEYTKEDLERIIDLIKKKMSNNSELNKHIRNTIPNIYNSDPLIEKLKNIYQFEVFILLIYKKYYSNIFSFITSKIFTNSTQKSINPTNLNILTKI